MKNKVISLFLSVFFSLIVTINAFSTTAYANTSDDSIDSQTQIYYMNDTKIVVNDEVDTVTVSVYVDNILDHTAEVSRITGEMIVKSPNNTPKVSNIKDYTSDINFNSTPSIRTPTAEGYTYLTQGSGYTPNPSLTAYLWYKDITVEGAAHAIRFTAGAAIGAITGFIISLIPGVNAINIITALGASVVGGTIGAAIDGDIWAVDMYKYFQGTCNGKTSLKTHRFSRYARVINKKNRKSTLEFVGNYGNWSDSSRMLYDTVNNYMAGIYY
ncbi:MAG: hypothetical protein RSF67_08980 [Clostridia bacterium]